ncbi:MmcQ/YjbR family DNA-binding protein [Kribbella sp. NPDC056345]|uniref:MmcQ/YjbR family DNA-binding protein n=1 Tax=Kribbella sp. NPDC056345 TaxID=3345789 RepID=UPI0035D888B5
MADWVRVGRVAAELPETAPGVAHEGSPTYEVAGRQFARLRWNDEGREILQFWVPDPADRQALVAASPDAYWLAKAFPSAVFAWLDQLDENELTEVVTDSWTARAPAKVRRLL